MRIMFAIALAVIVAACQPQTGPAGSSSSNAAAQPSGAHGPPGGGDH